MAEVNSYINSTSYDHIALTEGTLTAALKNTVGTAENDSTYTGQNIVTGAASTPVPALSGDVQFSMSIQRIGTQQPITVNFNLADMGSTPRSMSNVVTYMNGQLKAAGVSTRMAVNMTTGAPVTSTVNGATTTISAGVNSFGLQVVGSPHRDRDDERAQHGAVGLRRANLGQRHRQRHRHEVFVDQFVIEYLVDHPRPTPMTAPIGRSPGRTRIRRLERPLLGQPPNLSLSHPQPPQPASLLAGRVWHVSNPLDAAAMHVAAQPLLGRHDFTSFRAVACQAKSPIRTLDRLDVTRLDDIIEVTTEARSFLHHQVRNFVGTLKLVGEGRWPASRITRRPRGQSSRRGRTDRPSRWFDPGPGRLPRRPLQGVIAISFQAVNDIASDARMIPID